MAKHLEVKILEGRGGALEGTATENVVCDNEIEREIFILDLPVKSPGTEEGWIQNIRTVGTEQVILHKFKKKQEIPKPMKPV